MRPARRLGVVAAAWLALGAGCAALPEAPAASRPVAAGPLVLRHLSVHGFGGRVVRGPDLDYLVKTLEAHTDLRVRRPLTGVALDDPSLLALPWVRLPEAVGTRLATRDLTPDELSNLGRYLAGGGFLLARMPGDEKLRVGLYDVLRAALRTQRLNEGADWRFERLPASHPVYHAMVDVGSEGDEVGLVVGQRLAALLALRPILTDRAWVRSGLTQVDATPLLQFVANTVVYAVTRDRVAPAP